MWITWSQFTLFKEVFIYADNKEIIKAHHSFSLSNIIIGPLCGAVTGPTAPVCTETEMAYWRNFRHWLHRKLSFWQQLAAQPVTKFSWKWHFRFSVTVKRKQSSWNSPSSGLHTRKHDKFCECWRHLGLGGKWFITRSYSRTAAERDATCQSYPMALDIQIWSSLF